VRIYKVNVTKRYGPITQTNESLIAVWTGQDCRIVLVRLARSSTLVGRRQQNTGSLLIFSWSDTCSERKGWYFLVGEILKELLTVTEMPKRGKEAVSGVSTISIPPQSQKNSTMLCVKM